MKRDRSEQEFAISVHSLPLVTWDITGDTAVCNVSQSELVEVSDAIMVLRAVVGLQEFDRNEKRRAMVNDGETLTVTDAILILRKIVGLIGEFPVEHN